MRTRKKSASKPAAPAYPLPPEVTLTPQAQEDWARLARLLPLNRGPRLLFVLAFGDDRSFCAGCGCCRLRKSNGSKIATPQKEFRNEPLADFSRV